MDAAPRAGHSEYLWDTSLITSFHLEQKELGILAWSDAHIGGVDRQLYLPVGVDEKQNGPATSGEVILVPGAELREVYLTLALLKPDGSPSEYLAKDKPLHYGYYPSERGAAVSLPSWKSTGIYLLELGAELANGGVSTQRIWFYGG